MGSGELRKKQDNQTSALIVGCRSQYEADVATNNYCMREGTVVLSVAGKSVADIGKSSSDTSSHVILVTSGCPDQPWHKIPTVYQPKSHTCSSCSACGAEGAHISCSPCSTCSTPCATHFSSSSCSAGNILWCHLKLCHFSPVLLGQLRHLWLGHSLYSLLKLCHILKLCHLLKLYHFSQLGRNLHSLFKLCHLTCLFHSSRLRHSLLSLFKLHHLLKLRHFPPVLLGCLRHSPVVFGQNAPPQAARNDCTSLNKCGTSLNNYCCTSNNNCCTSNNKCCTSNGTTGPVNGVSIVGLPLAKNFDECIGHTDRDHSYHYHMPPVCLLRTLNVSTPSARDWWLRDRPETTWPARGMASPIVGWALDGFPIYGPYDLNGQLVTAAMLDECNGMFVAGMYRYYLTPNWPYVPRCFKGGPSKVTSDLMTPPSQCSQTAVDCQPPAITAQQTVSPLLRSIFMTLYFIVAVVAGYRYFLLATCGMNVVRSRLGVQHLVFFFIGFLRFFVQAVHLHSLILEILMAIPYVLVYLIFSSILLLWNDIVTPWKKRQEMAQRDTRLMADQYLVFGRLCFSVNAAMMVKVFRWSMLVIISICRALYNCLKRVLPLDALFGSDPVQKQCVVLAISVCVAFLGESTVWILSAYSQTMSTNVAFGLFLSFDSFGVFMAMHVFCKPCYAQVRKAARSRRTLTRTHSNATDKFSHSTSRQGSASKLGVCPETGHKLSQPHAED
eukprot:g19618.t1